MNRHDIEVLLLAYKLNFGAHKMDMHKPLDPGQNFRTSSVGYQMQILISSYSVALKKKTPKT